MWTANRSIRGTKIKIATRPIDHFGPSSPAASNRLHNVSYADSFSFIFIRSSAIAMVVPVATIDRPVVPIKLEDRSPARQGACDDDHSDDHEPEGDGDYTHEETGIAVLLSLLPCHVSGDDGDGPQDYPTEQCECRQQGQDPE